MIKRRGADFDLSALCGFAIGREDQTEQFELLGFERRLVALGEILALAGEAADYFVFRQPDFVHPGELRKDLQVAPVAGSERHLRLRTTRWARPLEQLNEARP